MSAPDLYVTNFNKNFTGVSATTAGVASIQQEQFNMRLVGQPLPNCIAPITKREAFKLSRVAPNGKPFAIWHVRRNPEMRAAIWARDVLRLPIKIVFTSAAQRFHSRHPRWLISKMDAVIATTSLAASYVPNVVATVPHGVDTALYRPSTNREAAWQALGYGGKRGVANMGRVRPEKGTDIFVDTMLEVLPKHPELVALIAGKISREHMSFQKMLIDRIATAGLSDRLLFVGEVAADKMPALVRALSLMVALPRYEGYGMTPLEALASGVPFVGSETGYFKEFVDGGNVGTVVPVENVKQSVEAIDAWLSDNRLLQKASDMAPDFVAQQHNIDTEVAGINAVYETLWNAGNRG